MGKRTKIWIKLLIVATILNTGLVWSGDKAFAAEGDVEINEVNFPDDNFRGYIKELDVNKDGNLSDQEIKRVISIDVDGSYGTWNNKEFRSIKGVEYFYNLENLNCRGHKIKEIDLSRNTKLKVLNLWGNNIKEIDLSKNVNLIELNCFDNKLTGIDLKNNSKLEKVEISFLLGVLDLSNSASLKELDARGITYLNVEGCTALKNLHAETDEINVTNCIELEILSSCNSTFSEIDISSCKNLKYLYLGSKKLKKLDVSQNKELLIISCDDSECLNELDLINNDKLTDLQLSIPLKKINFPMDSALKNIFLSESKLEEIDLSEQAKLESFHCRGGDSTSSIVFPNGLKLSEVEVYNTKVEYVDLSMCSGLESVSFINNEKLKHIEFPDTDELTSINCNSNKELETLDVKGCRYLIELYCCNDNLKELNLEENIYLDRLVCDNNHIKKLTVPKDVIFDLSGNEKGKVVRGNSLTCLHCASNELEELTLSNCNVLLDLDCSNNKIKRLDISLCDELINSVTEDKREEGGKVIYQLQSGYCLTCDSTVKVIMHGTVDEIFDDILAGEWYKDAVQFVYDRDIMHGVSETSFGPNGILTREQFITVLYNMEGAPKIEFKQIFGDVTDPTAWYAKSVTWASENKITSGIGNNLFGTGKEITREQLATLLYNYAQQKNEYKLDIDESLIAGFPDSGQISDWATTGMKWAVTNGVMGGKKGNNGQNYLDPQGKASRAECAQMIKNLKEKAVK